MLLEVCTDSINSCILAQEGGAQRIELCAALGEGGITPSWGLVTGAIESVQIPIYPIIRPRRGDFLYNPHEVKQMVTDIKYFRDLGVSGFSLGALTSDGDLNQDVCSELIDAADGLPITLHRAFDMSRDLNQTLEKAIDLGFSRILTSGGQQTAIEGIPIIKELVDQAGDRIIIMAGAGVKADNVSKLIRHTGVREVHGTFRRYVSGKMNFRKEWISMGGSAGTDEYDHSETDIEMIRKIVELL